MRDGLVVGDWGASRLRLWRIEHGGASGRREGPGVLATSEPRRALVAALGDWSPERIVLCGMAGARGALHETGYVACPAGMDDWLGQAADFELDGIAVRIAPGVACRDRQGRPDVMRGEETQLFGAMIRDRELSRGQHDVLLPGTHSKWATLEDGRITRFRTFITGELYALLGGSSLLGQGSSQADEEEGEGFAAGLDRASGGSVVTADLFEARAGRLSDGKSAEWARGFVSGLLIGAEAREMAPRGPLTVIGDEALSRRYARALAPVCDHIGFHPGDECAIAGLRLLDGHD